MTTSALWLTVAVAWLGACAIPLAVIDARRYRLPDPLTGLAYLGTVAFLVPAAAAGGHWPDFIRAVQGGLGLSAVFAVLAVVSRGAVGLGDAKLSASLGTALAWFGWPVLLAGVFGGFVIAALYGLALLATRRASWRQKIPFGPFMIAGAFVPLIARLASP